MPSGSGGSGNDLFVGKFGVVMPFKSRAQMKAMFAKGGKSAKTAKKWVSKYGVPGGKKKK